jgi:hypothetical protein
MPQFKRSAASLWQRLSERRPALVAEDYGIVAAFSGGKIIEYFFGCQERSIPRCAQFLMGG